MLNIFGTIDNMLISPHGLWDCIVISYRIINITCVNLHLVALKILNYICEFYEKFSEHDI